LPRRWSVADCIPTLERGNDHSSDLELVQALENALAARRGSLPGAAPGAGPGEPGRAGQSLTEGNLYERQGQEGRRRQEGLLGHPAGDGAAPAGADAEAVAVDWTPPANASLKEVHGAALREADRRYLQGQEHAVTNRETGDRIWISKTGLRKSISGHSGLQKMRVVPSLPDLIERGAFIGSAPDRKGRAEVLGYDFYAARAVIDGVPYRVRLAIREVRDGKGGRKKFYDHELTEVGEAAGEQGVVNRGGSVGFPPATASPGFIKQPDGGGVNSGPDAALRWMHEFRADHAGTLYANPFLAGARDLARSIGLNPGRSAVEAFGGAALGAVSSDDEPGSAGWWLDAAKG
jgi:hypothetical protein